MPALELVACRRLQLAQVVGAVVGHRVPLEPGPQVLHWIEVGGVEREEGNLDFLLDAALVQPKQAVGARQTGDDRDVGPVKVNWMMGVCPLGARVRTTFSLRSMARLSGFCGLKSSEPKMRQI